MKGYCESCSCERESVFDDYGASVCPECEGDLVVGIHVESEFDEDTDDFGAFLNRD